MITLAVNAPLVIQNAKVMFKHCKRHNGPKGWVLFTKVTSLGHDKSSNKTLDQISCSESTSKSQATSAFRLNLTSKSWPTLASESRPRLDFMMITSTKHRQQNTDQTSASKSRLNFKILTKSYAQSLNKDLTLWPNFSFQICTKLC